MKMRQGFVSNSSSSSFVIVVSKDAWDKEYDALHPYIKAHVDFLGRNGVMKTETFNGQEVMMFGYTSGNASPYEWGDGVEYEGEIPDEYEDHSEYVYEFRQKLSKSENLTCGFDF